MKREKSTCRQSLLLCPGMNEGFGNDDGSHWRTCGLTQEKRRREHRESSPTLCAYRWHRPRSVLARHNGRLVLRPTVRDCRSESGNLPHRQARLQTGQRDRIPLGRLSSRSSRSRSRDTDHSFRRLPHILRDRGRAVLVRRDRRLYRHGRESCRSRGRVLGHERGRAVLLVEAFSVTVFGGVAVVVIVVVRGRPSRGSGGGGGGGRVRTVGLLQEGQFRRQEKRAMNEEAGGCAGGVRGTVGGVNGDRSSKQAVSTVSRRRGAVILLAWRSE
jgi:hypothetical protein